MRVAFLTQYYPPEMGAPQARLSDLARRFVARGHEVHALTAMPNYPTGKVFDGYGGFYREELRDGVRVVRAAIFPTKSLEILPRMASYLSFAAAALVTGYFRLPASLDYLFTESPPLFLGPIGRCLARLKKARWIFNVSDLWPESAVRMGVVRDGWALRFAWALEAWCYRRAWLVTGQSQGIIEDISRRFPGTRVRLLTNGVDTDRFSPKAGDPAVRKELGWGDQECIAVYMGLHGAAQGLGQLLDAARLLEGPPVVRIVLFGDGPEKEALVRRCEQSGLGDRVEFRAPVPWEQVPRILASSDIVIACLARDLPGAVPSKIYEAMGVGKPLLLIAEGEPATLVKAHGAGITVHPQDIPGIAQTLRRLASDAGLRAALGESARAAALRFFDRARIAAQFIDHLEESLEAKA